MSNAYTSYHIVALAVVMTLAAPCPGAAPTRPSTAPAYPPAARPGEDPPLPPGATLRLGTFRFRHPQGIVYCMAFAPDGKSVAVGYSDGKLLLWDVADGHVLREFNGHRQEVTALQFSHDGRRLLSNSYLNAGD